MNNLNDNDNDNIYIPRSLNIQLKNHKLDHSTIISNKNEHKYNINDFPSLSPSNNNTITKSWFNILKKELLNDQTQIEPLELTKSIKKIKSNNKLTLNEYNQQELEKKIEEPEKILEQNNISPKKKQQKQIKLEDGWIEIKEKTKINKKKKKDNLELIKLTDELIKKCIN
jgi:hypothetical protein